PFVIVHSPLDLRTWTEGALFGLIPLTFPLLKRRLNLCFGRVAGARRALAGAVVSELHRAAQRALLFDAALGSAGAARDLATEFSERALGARESGEALLGRLLRTSRPDRDLVALVEAGVRSVEAQRSYDEDW